MKKLLILFKILYNSTYGISQLKYKVSKNKAEVFKFIGLLVAIAFSMSPMLIGYVFFMASTYDSLSTVNQAGALITMGVITSSLVVLFFGFFYVISTFYFTEDTEYLVSLPLKPWQILGAKFGVVLASEYLTVLPLALPPIVIYGIKSDAGILYWIYSVLSVIFIPVIPLCITSVIAVIVMRVTNIGRKRDLIRTVGSIAAVLAILGIQAYIQRTALSGGTDKIQSMLFSENGIIGIMSRNYPPSAWVSYGLIYYNSFSGLVYLLLFIVASIIFAGVFGYMGEKFFLGGYLGSSETESKRKRIDEGELSKRVSAGSRVSAVFWREFRILNRVPIFFMNCVFPVFLVPLIFIMMNVTGGEGNMSQIFDMLAASSGNTFLPPAIAIGICIFTVVANMTAPTSISREGASFFVSKYIPVSPKDQILGKMLHSIVIAAAGNLLAAAALGYMAGFSISDLLMIFLVSTVAAVPITEFSLIIDLFRPYLNWDNPQKAVKQNLNGILGLFLNALWSGIIVFFAARMIKNVYTGYAVLISIFAVLGFLLYSMVTRSAEKRYMQIEP